MKSILIIGMGMLGQCLATRMQELGNDVMVIDRDEDKIQELSTVFPDALWRLYQSGGFKIHRCQQF